MELTVKVRLVEHRDCQNGRKTIRVDLVNLGESPIRKIRLAFEYEYERPQDVSSEFDGRPGRILRVEELGRQMEFYPAVRDEGALEAGQSRSYLYPAEWFPALESVVAALSPERYRVAITMDGQREIAVPGEAFGEFIQRCALTQEEKDGSVPAPIPPVRSDADRPDAAASLPAEASGGPPSESASSVRGLVDWLLRERHSFEVFPPTEVLDDPAILSEESAWNRLLETRWRLRFADGQEMTLRFPDLMIAACRLMMLCLQCDALRRGGGLAPGGEMGLAVRLDVAQLLTPGGAKRLLSRLSFGEADHV